MNPIYELRNEKLEQSLHIDLRRIVAVGAPEYDTTSKLAVLQIRIMIDDSRTIIVRAKNPGHPEADTAINEAYYALLKAWTNFSEPREKLYAR